MRYLPESTDDELENRQALNWDILIFQNVGLPKPRILVQLHPIFAANIVLRAVKAVVRIHNCILIECLKVLFPRFPRQTACNQLQR